MKNSPSARTSLFSVLPVFALVLAPLFSPAAASASDCRTWNPDTRAPHDCQWLLRLHEMVHGGSGYVPSDNLFELFVVTAGATDQFQGIQYVKNRGTSFTAADRDSDGAPRLAFIAASLAQLEQPGGVVMNPNHDAIKLAVSAGFDPSTGGNARMDYLVDGAVGRRSFIDFRVAHNARGDWALFTGSDPRPVTALDAFTNYGIFNMTIGVRNIAPEY